MGEAKRRGSNSDRIANALGLKKVSLGELKKNLGLPDSAEFLGYAVHLIEKDEFLSQFDESVTLTRKTWTKSPELAKSYDDISEAYKASQKCAGSLVVGLFDTGNQIVVFPAT